MAAHLFLGSTQELVKIAAIATHKRKDIWASRPVRLKRDGRRD